MPKGELYINGKDAYTEWGVSMTTTSMSTLLAPAPNKEPIENKSRAQHGKKIVPTPARKDERDLNLILNMTARDDEEFFARYYSFCKELDGGIIEIRTKHQPNVCYRTIYRSCQQYTQFIRRIATIGLKLNEPDPTNRDIS